VQDWAAFIGPGELGTPTTRKRETYGK